MLTQDNVIGQVTDAISDQSPAAAIRFARDFKDNGEEPAQQIRNLNRYWRTELGALHTSTISARTCLIDEIDPGDWMRHFRRMVLPVIIQYDLPRG